MDRRRFTHLFILILNLIYFIPHKILIYAGNDISDDSTYLELDASAFNSVINENNLVLINFNAPW